MNFCTFPLAIKSRRAKSANNCKAWSIPFQEPLFEVVKAGSPLTFPQILRDTMCETSKLYCRSGNFVKHVLRELVKQKRVQTLRNPIPGCNNYLYHVGKGLEPENPDMCPNTSSLRNILEKEKNRKAFEEAQEDIS